VIFHGLRCEIRCYTRTDVNDYIRWTADVDCGVLLGRTDIPGRWRRWEWGARAGRGSGQNSEEQTGVTPKGCAAGQSSMGRGTTLNQSCPMQPTAFGTFT
jgi:hypothetical protein